MFRNFTPHPINLTGYGKIPSEGIARIKENRREYGKVGWGEVSAYHTSITYAEIEGMPDNWQESKELIIVSRPIAERVHLPHIVCPDKLVRDSEGNITGCEGFAWFPSF